ncbi:hypothetical protein ACE6H2_021264 [Prunus campanulata]
MAGNLAHSTFHMLCYPSDSCGTSSDKSRSSAAEAGESDQTFEFQVFINMALAVEESESSTTSTTISFNQNAQMNMMNGECESGCQRPPFGKKCRHLLKKQRTKFYILRRCIAMLLCWHERSDP